jgi:hypothetical protein
VLLLVWTQRERQRNSREVCDGKRRILVEVLRLDEALEQVPAHGGWRWRRWVLCCEEVGMCMCMGIGRVCLLVHSTMEMR